MQSWIEDALASVVNPDVVNPERSHFNPEYLPWLTHRFATFKKDPSVHGRLGSELTRAVVEKYGPDVEVFKDQIGENDKLSAQQRNEVYADLNAMASAYEFLRKFQEHARLEFKQGTIPFPAAPIMGPEAELDLSPKQVTGDQEIAGQTETATEVPAIESSETSETTAELEQSNGELALLVDSGSGDLRRASFDEIEQTLVKRCQESYQRLLEITEPDAITTAIHAQKLASDWAEEIRMDQKVRTELDKILIRSVRRLGQVRAAYRKNGGLKRGKGGRLLFVDLHKETLRQSDKLAKIEDDADFESRLQKKAEINELTRYATLEEPQAPAPKPKWGWFYAALVHMCEEADECAKGRYQDEDRAGWADLRGRYSQLQSIVGKLKEFLDDEVSKL